MSKKDRQNSQLFGRILSKYYSKLLLLNQEEENSIKFLVLIETLRFFLGHSQIFTMTMMQSTTKQQIRISIFNRFGSMIDSKDTQNNWLMMILSIGFSTISVLTFALFCLNEKIQKQYKLMRIVYFLGHIIQVSSEFFFAIFGYIVFISINTGDFLPLLIIIPAFIINIFFFKITVIFQQKNNFETNDLYSHGHNVSVYGINLLFCLITFTGVICSMSHVGLLFANIIKVIWVGLQLLRLKMTVIDFFYDKQQTFYAYSLVVCLQTVQMLVFLFYDLTKLDLIGQNVILIIFLMTAFLYWSITNYSNSISQTSYFRSIDQLKLNKDIYLLFNSYFMAFQGLSGKIDKNVQLLISSIKKNHKNNCKKSECYCHQQNNLHEFLEQFVLQQLKLIEYEHSTSKQIILYLISFKFHIYNFYSTIHAELKKFEQNFILNHLERLFLLTLKSKVKKWVQLENKKVNSLSTDVVLDFQEQMYQINDIIIHDISCKYQKWTLLTKGICKVSQIRELSEKQLQNMIQIQRIKHQKQSSFSRSLAFNSILYFYFKKISLKMSDLFQIQQKITDLSRKIKQQELFKSQIFIKHLFNRNCCTFQCSIQNTNIGQISQVSKSVLNVFGYEQSKILGKNVSCLVPKFLRNEHQNLMKCWIEKGGNFVSQKIGEVFCLHNQNYVFQSFKYFKIHADFNKISLVATFFKKSDNDILLIDDNFMLQSYGKSFQSMFRNIPPIVYSDYVFKNMKRKIKNASLSQEKDGLTIIYNEDIIKKLYQTRRKSSFEKQIFKDFQTKQNQNFETFIQKFLDTPDPYSNGVPQKTAQFDNIWKMQFKYRKSMIFETEFYVIKAKSLQYIQVCDEDKSKNNQANLDNFSQVQDYLQQENNKIQRQRNRKKTLHQYENSSMASYSTVLGYGISKMITHFGQILLQPKKLSDKRSKVKLFSDIFFFLSLITIVFLSLVINRLSLDDKMTLLRVKSSIDRTFHLMEVTTNNIYNSYMYRRNITLQKLAVKEAAWDSEKFNDEYSAHFNEYNKRFSPLKSGLLYKYLRKELTWNFPRGTTPQIELLEFFKMTNYVATIVQNEYNLKFQNLTADFNLTREMFSLLGLNVQNLRNIRDTLTVMTLNQLDSDSQVNEIAFILSTTLFFVFSLTYSWIVDRNRRFRHHQLQNQSKIYQMIESSMLLTLRDYYFMYYHHLVDGKVRLDNSFINDKELEFERQIEEVVVQNQHSEFNKIKLVMQKRYWVWIVVSVIFIIMNGSNLSVGLKMYEFNEELGFFATLTNSISQGESILLNRLIRLKQTYYFDKPALTQNFLTIMLSRIDSGEVSFNSYATFKPNWITQNDMLFRSEFNQMLLESPCELNKQQFNHQQLETCHKFSQLSENGIITFVNGFSRLMRNTLIYWKQNLNFILNQTDFLGNRTQFHEIDFVLTFHVETFSKLNERIINVYEGQFLDEFQTCIVLAGIIITLALIGLGWNVINYLKDRKTLSMLYGYILLVPPMSIKNSKYLVKFLEQNLQFQWEY